MSTLPRCGSPRPSWSPRPRRPATSDSSRGSSSAHAASNGTSDDVRCRSFDGIAREIRRAGGEAEHGVAVVQRMCGPHRPGNAVVGDGGHAVGLFLRETSVGDDSPDGRVGSRQQVRGAVPARVDQRRRPARPVALLIQERDSTSPSARNARGRAKRAGEWAPSGFARRARGQGPLVS